MLHRLKYSVTFPSTGRTLSADLTFSKGMTAILGPNESGKSMVLEVARWLLFGTAALRGSAEDYKSLVGYGAFEIKGNIIELDRSARGATMKRNGVAVATGTKPVNAKVVEELGFGLSVFDIANSINQGEVEKLGAMTPTARKAMVDSVLGLAVLDLVSKWAAEEAKLLDRQAEGLKERLTPPGAPPVEPKGWLPPHSVEGRLAEARHDADELVGIEGWLAAPAPGKPEQPTTKVDLPSENLVSLAAKRADARERLAGLSVAVNALPASAAFSGELLDTVEEAWDAYDAFEIEVQWAKANPLPGTSYVDLIQMQVAWDLRTEWGHYENQVREVERLRAALENVEKVTCPSCAHDFALHADHAARLGAELELAEQGMSDIRPPQPKPDEPKLKSAEIDRLLAAWENADEARHAALPAEPPKPDMTRREIDTYRRQLEQVAEREPLAAELAVAQRQFDAMADYEAMLAERRRYEDALTVFHGQQEAYNSWKTEAAKKQARKAQLAGAVEARTRLEEELRVSREYETARERYDTTHAAYIKGVAEIGRLEEEADEHRKVREVMAVLRGLIKQHVVPSLNVVASQLLRQMTGGQRNLIHVDDDFNVKVDDQNLDTLSGSGKACANLALRIALGQVLTNRVFSIMLADEIDASMDEFRSEQTADVLRMLEERVSQVLLVSHKPVDAPHHVRLGGFSADDDKPGTGS